LGYTIQRPTEDRYVLTQAELEQKVCVLLGGRAAEKLMLGTLSTGAADDLAKATQIAREMVTRYGMDEQLGHVSYDSMRAGMVDASFDYPVIRQPMSELTQRGIDAAIRHLVMTNFDRALKLLGMNRAILERGAQDLLLHETLDALELTKLAAQLVQDPSP
jgi:cell division protease FtsH